MKIVTTVRNRSTNNTWLFKTDINNNGKKYFNIKDANGTIAARFSVTMPEMDLDIEYVHPEIELSSISIDDIFIHKDESEQWTQMLEVST